MTTILPREDPYETQPLYRWIALAAGLLAWGFDGVEQGVYTIMTRPALKDLIPGLSGLPPDQMDGSVGFYFGLSMAMWLWGAAAGGIIFGCMGDRFGRVRSLMVSVTTYAVFTGLSALSTHWTHLAACRFLGATGLGGTWPLAVALVMETWPEQRRSVLAGAIGAAANVGYLIAATYSRVMLSHGSTWRWVIGMGFFIGMACLPVLLFVPEPTKWRISREKKQRSSLKELFTRRYRRSTIVGSLLSMTALLGTWGSFLWLSAYVDQIAKGTEYEITAKAIVSQWQSFGQILGGFLGGVVAGWLGNKKSWCLLCVAAWVSVMALFGLTVRFDGRVIWFAATAGVFVTAFFGWLPKFLPELYPTRIRATGQGFSYNVGRIISGLGVLGAGTSVSLFHGDYRISAMTVASIYLMGLVFILFAPDTGGKMLADEGDAPAGESGQRP